MAKVKKTIASFLCFVYVFGIFGFDFGSLKAYAATYVARDWSELKSQINKADSTTIWIANDIITDELDNRVIIDQKKDLTIDLLGHSIKKNNGSSTYTDGHIFEIMGDSTVTLTDSFNKGGSLEYGCGNNGGAINIHAGSTLTVNNVVFQNNRAGIDGGAICNRGTLIMNDCIVKNNTAKDTGGGIFNSGEGKFELNNTEICYNHCDNDGGGLNIHTSGTSVMKNCNIHHNTSNDEGAGFRFDDNGETLELYNTTITDNVSNDDGGGFYLEDGTIKLYGCDISRNKAKYGGGFYAEKTVVLESSDYGINVISGNNATHRGGGIYTNGETTINSADITENVAYDDGGGIYVRNGKCQLNGAKVQRNTASYGDGGGVFIEDAEVWIRHGEVTGNMAFDEGGGIYCDMEMDKLHVSQTPVVRNNDASWGNDLYLYSCDTIDLDGSLETGAYISFTFFYGHQREQQVPPKYTHDIEFNEDVTTDYSDHNGSTDPNLYFHCAEKYKLKLKGGDVQVTKDRLPAEPVDPAEYPDPIKKNTFIPWNEQIDFNTRISGNNWLSGISGERKLNEINTPVSHDSSMKDIAGGTSSAGTALGFFDNAVTQYKYINELLDIGIRRLDLRVANKRVWKKNRGSGDQTDDGENLFMCHGEDNAGGTYYAEDPVTGYPLNFLTVLGWIEDFLRRNPTEYVMVMFKAECQHDYDKPITYERLDKILKEHIDDINPTTGEPYFYLQDGVYGRAYNDWPKLKDVRGKIVICGGNEGSYVSGLSYGGLRSEDFGGKYYVPSQEGSYKDSASTRLKNIKAFANNEIATRDLPTDASRLIDAKTGKEVFVAAGTNCVDAGWGGIPGITPIEGVEEIHPEIYGPGKIYSPENKGKYLGWVSGDGATALTCKYVYDANYFDGLQYVTVNVLSNKNGIPNQSYKLLKGSEITVPGYIYDYQQSEANGYFKGWSIGNGDILEEGSKYAANSDVTFKANWLTDSSPEITRASVVWKDADNKDGLRADEISLRINGKMDYTIKASNKWSRSLPVPVYFFSVNWDKASSNTDGAGTYKCDISGDNDSGWVITFTHTPSDKIDINSKVSFFDDVDTYRPDSVTLGIYEKGSGDLIQQKDFAIGKNSEAEQTFSQLPKYKDGEEISYEIRYISCTNNSGNTTDLEKYKRIISGYDVEYRLIQMKDVDLNIFWNDIAKENRPETVDVKFKNKDTGTVYTSIEYINQDDGISSVCTFALPVDSISEGTEVGIVDFDKYDVEVNTTAQGIFFNVFKNEEGYYIAATGTEYESAVAMVEALIDNIGTITNDNRTESRPKLEAAEFFYDLLSESDKEQVSNYDKLVLAEEQYFDIAEKDHIYENSIVQPTCTAKGYTIHTCKLCGYTYSDSYVNALGHDYKATVVAPTCTSRGYTHHKCTRCNDEYNDTETEMTAHSFGDWITTTAPTCTAKGVETRKCKNCEATETREVKSLSHDYVASIIPPTCTSKGYTNHKCTRCEDEYNDTETEMTAHSFGDWRITTEPTCTEKGVETRKCKNCEETETRDVDALGHKWSEWKTTSFDVNKGISTQIRTCSACNKTESKTTENAMQRLAGSGRYETAAKISQAAFVQADTVVLAYGLNYADALAGVSLATSLNAPILLTNTKSLDPTTLAEIKRLKAKNVIILGGEGAISTVVENSLKKEGLATERIAGTSRFGTATAIAEKLTDAPIDVFFVYAFNSADALSVCPIAACKNAPIIYLSTNGDLHRDTAAYLAKLKKAGCVKNAYVIGGTGVISDDMMSKAAKALGLSKATRIAGENRFATCVEVNEKFADVLDGDMLCVATGMDFPDALAGGVYAAINKAPLFLINGKLKTPKLTDEQKAYLKTKAAGKITTFGGVGVVPDSHIADIAKNSV